MAHEIDPIRRVFLARWIRERRVARGLSIEDAARVAGISRNTWRNAENGLPVQDSKLGRIEQALSWGPGSVLSLLSGDADQPKLYDPVPDDALPVGTGVDPLDLSEIEDPTDREYLRTLYERFRRKE